MSPLLAETLFDLQAAERRARPLEPSTWVFALRDGSGPIQETTLFRAWRNLRLWFAPYGARPLTLHSARHTWATLALEAGRSVKWVAEQLGHADPMITLRTYAHVMPTEESDLGFLDLVPVADLATKRQPTDGSAPRDDLASGEDLNGKGGDPGRI